MSCQIESFRDLACMKEASTEDVKALCLCALNSQIYLLLDTLSVTTKRRVSRVNGKGSFAVLGNLLEVIPEVTSCSTCLKSLLKPGQEF